MKPDEVIAIRAADVEPENVRWLWRDWVPLGMQTAIVGMPGFGKSTLAVKLAAATTTGDLEGDLFGEPADALFISYEDAVVVTLRPMAEAAGADLERVHFLQCHRTGYTIDLTAQLPRIEQIAVERGARLLVIDPLVAGLPNGKIDSHRDQSVRSVLAPLAALAEEHDLSILTTGHLAKAATSALLGTGGSIGFIGAPRSIMVFGPRPDDDDGVRGRRRVLAHAKCNVGRLQRSREVGIMPATIAGDVATRVAVIGNEVETEADDLVKPPDKALSPRVQAEKFLRELLADGSHRAAEVIELAADDGIAEKTLRRAKSDLSVISYQQAHIHWWKLPAAEDVEAAEEGEE